MQEYYKHRATNYDVSMGYDNESTIYSQQPVIRYLQESFKDQSLLEIACGPCFWTQFVAKTAKSILATDYNETTLVEAHKKNIDWSRVSLKQIDAYNLPSFPQKFTGAFAVDWFAHVPLSKRHKFLSNLHSCLVSNSEIIFCDQLPGNNSLTGNYDHEGNHLQKRSLPDGTIFTIIKNYLTENETLRLFKEFSSNIEIKQFPESKRWAIRYKI